MYLIAKCNHFTFRYPNDLSKRAKIHSVLDWHHTNLRPGASGYVLNSVLAPALGLPLNPKAAAEAENILTNSLSTLETFWLKGSAKFLLGGKQPSIADLSLVCELMQLQVRKKIIFFTNFYLFY
jgi:glutathione S-transferase